MCSGKIGQALQARIGASSGDTQPQGIQPGPNAPHLRQGGLTAAIVSSVLKNPKTKAKTGVSG